MLLFYKSWFYFYHKHFESFDKVKFSAGEITHIGCESMGTHNLGLISKLRQCIL